MYMRVVYQKRMEITIRRMQEADLDAADRIVRVAFGTFLGLPDPTAMFGDADYVRTRFETDPAAAFSAVDGDRVVGSNFVSRWGTFGFFGPLSVDPLLWNQGVARKLLVPAMELFESSHVPVRGLFTFPQSTKHVHLYQQYGFWPRFLTAVCQRNVVAPPPATQAVSLSALSLADHAAVYSDVRRLLDGVYPGLDLSREMESIERQGIGETLVRLDGSRVVALAVCHLGAGSEAGSGACYVKFAAARRDGHAAKNFEDLIAAVERFAIERGASRVVAGVNTARHEAYRRMLARGYRPILLGISMVAPNVEAFCRADDFVIDDWR